MTMPGTSARTSVFTRSELREMLAAGRDSGYDFRPFERRTEPGEPACLLRHDIDLDLGAAADVAAVEAKLGVRATYFLMLRSPGYNLFSRSNHRFVEEIISYGHWIGLHFDQGFSAGARSVEEQVQVEAQILEQMFDIEVRVVSFHQPGPKVLRNEIEVAPLINTYDQRDMAGFTYVSDSNMMWREQTGRDIFSGILHRRLHILIHPMWWVSDDPGVTTQQAFNRALTANLERMQEQMLQTERAYGPPRRFDIIDR